MIHGIAVLFIHLSAHHARELCCMITLFSQTMSHIVESCPLTKLNGGLSRLHSADADTVSWLTSYG